MAVQAGRGAQRRGTAVGEDHGGRRGQEQEVFITRQTPHSVLRMPSMLPSAPSAAGSEPAAQHSSQPEVTWG